MNSGRLSVPCTYDGSPLNTPDALPDGPRRTRPGSSCADAPVGEGFLLDHLRQGDFVLLGLNTEVPEGVTAQGIAARALTLPAGGPLAERYLGDAPQAVYLIRPDQHVAARWPAFDRDAACAAIRRATGN